MVVISILFEFHPFLLHFFSLPNIDFFFLVWLLMELNVML